MTLFPFHICGHTHKLSRYACMFGWSLKIVGMLKKARNNNNNSIWLGATSGRRWGWELQKDEKDHLCMYTRPQTHINLEQVKD